jgi:hypothetical protein
MKVRFVCVLYVSFQMFFIKIKSKGLLLRVKIPKLINIIGILIIKKLLVVVIYNFLSKDETNGIS